MQFSIIKLFGIKMNIRIEQNAPTDFKQLFEAPQPYLLKKSVRINNPKLPSDFFGARARSILGVSNISQRPECLKTQSQSRMNVENNQYTHLTPGPLSSRTRRVSYDNKRDSQTANDDVGREMKLIMGIIQTNRQMRKVFRKHSVQLKKTNKKDGLYLELPPLGIKSSFKSFTANI